MANPVTRKKVCRKQKTKWRLNLLAFAYSRVAVICMSFLRLKATCCKDRPSLRYLRVGASVAYDNHPLASHPTHSTTHQLFSLFPLPPPLPPDYFRFFGAYANEAAGQSI